MTDPHHLLEAWLAEGAVGDPPREIAVHAAVCDSCARRLGAFDSLARVDIGAAGSPPPLGAPSRIAIGLAWARVGAGIAGTVVAGIFVVFAATQLGAFVGSLPAASDGIGLGSPSGEGPEGSVLGATGSIAPEPGQPSIPEPTSTPIPSFIPLPSLDPQATPLPAPAAPSLARGAVTHSTISISWSNGPGGGPVQKWEVWRRTGAGGWFKLGELAPGTHALTNGGLAPGTTYSYRIRGVNASWLGPFSNTVSGTTLAAPPSPTPAPTPPPTPTPSPSVPPSVTPECSDDVDNDSDGWTDWPADPGCSSAGDNDELPVNSHECNDGLDNDGDGWTDGSDPSCGGPFDDSEAPQDPHQCNDSLDNDGDLLTDFPLDLGCSDPFDDTEDTL